MSSTDASNQHRAHSAHVHVGTEQKTDLETGMIKLGSDAGEKRGHNERYQTDAQKNGSYFG